MTDSESEKTVVYEEDNNVFVVDPEDYQKTRKFRAISDAKERVRKKRDDDSASPARCLCFFSVRYS